MNSIKSSVVNCTVNAPNDNVLINDLCDIIEKKGDVACQVIFQTLINLDLAPQAAMICWHDVLQHREEMYVSLGREINLLPAMCDYLYLTSKVLKHPMVVELDDFHKVLNDSTHDSLTGLFNRQFFMDTLKQQVSYAKRSNTHLSILFMDVDDFKDINDMFGHTVGDKALQSISAIISREKRESDVAIRYGGEEFIVLMPNTGNINGLILGERIRNAVEQKKIDINGKQLGLSISGGLASFPMHADNYEDLLNYADSALYRAKGAGKNNISVFKGDKRQFLRIPLKQAVKVKALGFDASQTSFGESKNICIGGVLFESDEPLSVREKIQVSLPVHNDDPLLLIGTIVRVEVVGMNRYDIAMTISFKEMDKIAKSEISSFLTEQVKKTV